MEKNRKILDDFINEGTKESSYWLDLSLFQTHNMIILFPVKEWHHS
jgi:hypothetical protein